MKAPTGSPCRECPWRRVSAPGWLGPYTADEWRMLAHSDDEIACHLTIPEGFDDDPDADTSNMTTCSGATIYRRNVCKSPRFVPPWPLEGDRVTVFGNPMEFAAHHERKS